MYSINAVGMSGPGDSLQDAITTTLNRFRIAAHPADIWTISATMFDRLVTEIYAIAGASGQFAVSTIEAALIERGYKPGARPQYHTQAQHTPPTPTLPAAPVPLRQRVSILPAPVPTDRAVAPVPTYRDIAARPTDIYIPPYIDIRPSRHTVVVADDAGIDDDAGQFTLPIEQAPSNNWMWWVAGAMVLYLS